MINAFTASLPDRVNTLERAVKSILPQVDTMQVVLNNYDHVPYFLINDKIKVVRHDNSMEDGSRFINIGQVSGYVLVFDDDIEYPKNYVQYMMQGYHDLSIKYRVFIILFAVSLLTNIILLWFYL